MTAPDAPARQWHIVTGEYPPQPGGVADYTAAVAGALAKAGDDVHVWCPGVAGTACDSGVVVHAVAGRWQGEDFAHVDALLGSAAAPRHLLVQWVPHAYGRRSLNVAFCRWVQRRAAQGDRVELMVHEPFLGFREGSWRQDLAAAVHRAMAALLLRAATRVWISVPAWADSLKPWALGKPLSFCWLPIPSTIPVARPPERASGLRARLAAPGEVVIGHFGTYGRHVAQPLALVARDVLERSPRARLLLLGRGSRRFANAAFGDFAARVTAAEDLAPEELSWHLQSCDVMLQPYPDGVSTRRTTAMAALAHGLPMVTTTGRLSEAFWPTSPAVVAVPAGNPTALSEALTAVVLDPDRRRRLASAASALYRERFDLAKTIHALRTGSCPQSAEAGGAAR